jgi:small redox-active disulfide protein 2
MKKIQILGPGCPNCRKLAEVAESVATDLGLEYELEKVTDIGRMIDFGVLAPPALVLDGKVLVSGRVPSPSEIMTLLQED